MPAPENTFKSALARGDMQYGCWAGFADPYATEIMASAGFDWLVIDGEHAPNDLRSISAQLQAMRDFDSHPVVRLPMGEAWLIKQVLDAGAQTLLIPMVESAEQARDLGFAGKGSVHPKQIAALNDVFTPSPAQITRARRIINEFEAANTGLVVIDGKLIEKPVLRDMYRIVAIADRMGE